MWRHAMTENILAARDRVSSLTLMKLRKLERTRISTNLQLSQPSNRIIQSACNIASKFSLCSQSTAGVGQDTLNLVALPRKGPVSQGDFVHSDISDCLFDHRCHCFGWDVVRIVHPWCEVPDELMAEFQKLCDELHVGGRAWRSKYGKTMGLKDRGLIVWVYVDVYWNERLPLSVARLALYQHSNVIEIKERDE